MEIPCEYIVTGLHKLTEHLERCLDLTENPAVHKVKMLRRKDEEKGKQQLESSKNKKS